MDAENGLLPSNRPRQPVMPDLPEFSRHAGFLWRWSPPRATENFSADSDAQSTAELDTTSGMDEAIRRGDALTQAVGQRNALLFGGGDSLDLGAIMAADAQIRNLRSYLQAIGPVSESRPYASPVPLVRTGRIVNTNRSSARSDGSVTTGGWDAYQ